MGDGFGLSHVGNAGRFQRDWGEGLRYDSQAGWYVYRDSRWVRTDDVSMVQLALETISRLGEIPAQGENERDQVARWSKSCQGYAAVRQILDLGKCLPGVLMKAGDWEEAQWRIHTPLEWVDLQTGERGPAGPSCLNRRVTAQPVGWEVGPPWAWLQFLGQIFPRPGLIDYVQRALGYCLTGNRRERVLFVAYGTGRNGKSTLLETVSRVIGDYANVMPAGALAAADGSSDYQTAIASLRGVRMALASESGPSARLAESFVKSVTGDRILTARHLYHDAFTFEPEFKVWLMTNHRPRVVGTDEGIWDRIRLIPFETRIEDDQVDKDLAEKLNAEGPAILHWLLQGVSQWMTRELTETSEGENPTVASCSADYRREQDILAGFIEDCCIWIPGGWVESGRLYRCYQKWAKGEGLEPISHRALSMQLQERGAAKGSTGHANIRIYKGLELSGDGEKLVQTERPLFD